MTAAPFAPLTRLEQLQRDYACALRSAEEHGLPLDSHKAPCCGEEVLLARSAAPRIIDCPFCGRECRPSEVQA